MDHNSAVALLEKILVALLARGGGEVNRWMDGGVPFWLLNWYPKI